jgi:hypothetical protein
MLLPEAHEIFVCASNCLRGVVLTAAEMNAQDRFSTVELKEEDIIQGHMEEILIEGVTDILRRLPRLPKAVLVYTSCIQRFMATDLEWCFKTLRERFPNLRFTDCYMTPIARKAWAPPVVIMYRQLYSLLEAQGEKDARAVNVIGNNVPMDETNDAFALLHAAGWTIRDITRCKTWDDYEAMAKSSLNLVYNAKALAAAVELEKRLGQPYLYLPRVYGAREIKEEMKRLAVSIGVNPLSAANECAHLEARANDALADAFRVIGGTQIAVDATGTPFPLGLARLLCENGFHVTRLYADSFAKEEEADFAWLKDHRPDISVYPMTRPESRRLACVEPHSVREKDAEKILALGQEAAFFCGTNYFVNEMDGNGMFGFDGITHLASLMTEAFLHEKDARCLIQRKALGCPSCVAEG